MRAFSCEASRYCGAETTARAQQERCFAGLTKLAPNWKQLAFEDRSPHCPGAIGHKCRDEPLFSELTETPGFKETSFLALLLDSGGPPLAYCALCIDALLASACERQSRRAVLSENHCLASTMQTVVEPERQRPGGRYDHVHAVAVGDLVRFFLWSQRFKRSVCQQELPLQVNTVGHF